MGKIINGIRLLKNWRAVLARAWSIRLMILAGVFSGLEVFTQFVIALGIDLPIPPMLFAALSGLSSTAAVIARLVAQEGITNAKGIE